MRIPMGRSDYFRSVAKEARIRTINRYFENNPILTDDQVALIARPGMRRWLSVGAGPIQGLFSQGGTFSNALFVLSENDLHRVETDGVSALVLAGVAAATATSQLVATATGTIGALPEFLYFARGSTLYLYAQGGFAQGTLTGTPVNTDTVRLGNMYYQFTNASVNAGAPAGTLANPWRVQLGVDGLSSYQNLDGAIDNLGIPGVTYSTALIENPLATAISATGGAIVVRARTVGIIGNGVITTETGSLAWGAATLVGGGSPSVTPVQTPDDVGVISLGYIGGYVIVVVAQGAGVNGRFYWIAPGETTIDPLDFATAERSPDPIFEVVVFNDQFWLPGQSTTEVWYLTGDANSPVIRLQGITFDRGTLPGTALRMKDNMIIIDSDGAVFKIGAGSISRISPPDIEERIRLAAQIAK